MIPRICFLKKRVSMKGENWDESRQHTMEAGSSEVQLRAPRAEAARDPKVPRAARMGQKLAKDIDAIVVTVVYMVALDVETRTLATFTTLLQRDLHLRGVLRSRFPQHRLHFEYPETTQHLFHNN
jgi:hypothetical protein